MTEKLEMAETATEQVKLADPEQGSTGNTSPELPHVMSVAARVALGEGFVTNGPARF